MELKSYKMRNGVCIRHEDVLGMEKSGLSDPQIALEYGITRAGFGKIRKKTGWLREYRGYRSDKGVYRKDPDEKRLGWNRYIRGYNRLNVIKRSHTRIGKKTYATSRLVAEGEILGRKLKVGEVVHHIDGNSENDDPRNLMVFGSQGDHMKYHNGDEIAYVAKYQGLCFFCGDVVTLANKGISVTKGKEVNNACRECCVRKSEEYELMEEFLKEKWKI